MEILSGIKIIDLGLYIKKERVLVIADLHIGYEEMLNKQGVLIPRHQLKDIMTRLDNVFSKVKPKTIVINGDLKHEFGSISEQEWRDTLKVVDYLSRKGRLVLVKGNHDTILGPISRKREIEFVESYKVGDVLILHGDKIISENCKTIILGHEHPAITLKENGRAEKYKCFLRGKWRKKDIIVMPSMNTVTEGTDVLEENLLSPYLKNIDDFNVFISTDKVYDFGKVKDLK